VNLFLDTEFTFGDADPAEGLVLGRATPKLISLALAAEDGSFVYVEINDWFQHECSSWVRENVLPLLGESQARVTRRVAAHRILEFLDRFSEVTIWTDVPHVDVDLLLELLGAANGRAPIALPEDPNEDAREGLELIEYRVATWDDDRRGRAFAAEVERCFAPGGGLRQHRAGDDARAMMCGLQAALRVPE
jgi:hypothetical protein